MVEKPVLRVGAKVRAELIALFTLAGARRSGPVGFVKWAGDVGDVEIVRGENFACVVDFFRVQLGDVFVPHRAEFDPLEAEVL